MKRAFPEIATAVKVSTTLEKRDEHVTPREDGDRKSAADCVGTIDDGDGKFAVDCGGTIDDGDRQSAVDRDGTDIGNIGLNRPHAQIVGTRMIRN